MKRRKSLNISFTWDLSRMASDMTMSRENRGSLRVDVSECANAGPATQAQAPAAAAAGERVRLQEGDSSGRGRSAVVVSFRMRDAAAREPPL